MEWKRLETLIQIFQEVYLQGNIITLVTFHCKLHNTVSFIHFSLTYLHKGILRDLVTHYYIAGSGHSCRGGGISCELKPRCSPQEES